MCLRRVWTICSGRGPYSAHLEEANIVHLGDVAGECMLYHGFIAVFCLGPTGCWNVVIRRIYYGGVKWKFP
jgi:hypothetical protein